MSEPFVVVVSFDTTPENHEEARALIGSYVRDFLSQQPGFLESWLNEKKEGTGLLHFARWREEADFRAFAEIASGHPDLPKMREFQPSANFYRPLERFGD